MKKTKEEQIRNYLENLLVEEFIPIYERYCEETDNDCIKVLLMENFNNEFSGFAPIEIARIVLDSEDFTPEDDFFWHDENDGIHSFSFVNGKPGSPYDVYEIAHFCADCREDLDDPYIRKILNEAILD